MQKFTFLFICFFGIMPLHAQYQIGLIPRTSPDKAVYQKIGFNEVEIRYGSPRVKGRTIWGSLEAYGEVWRAGANNATTVSFTQAVLIQGMELKADTYALFIIPKLDSAWTVIFSKKHKQWGSFRYDSKDDALRIHVQPNQADFQEQLQYSILSKELGQGMLRFQWEKVQFDISFTFDYIQSFIEKINTHEATSDTKWATYLQGAEFLLDEKKNLDTALIWLTKSEKLFQIQDEKWHNGEHYFLGHIYWVTALIYAERGDFVNAVKNAERVIAFEHKKSFYKRKNETEKIDNKIEVWKKEIKK